MGSSMNPPPFTESEVDAAVKFLSDAEFPRTEFLISLEEERVAEVYFTYVIAASESLRELGHDDDPQRLVEVSRRNGALLDRIVTWLGTSIQMHDGGPTRTIACKRACNYCCHLRVNALAPEVASIKDFIEQEFSPEEKEQTLNSLSDFLTKVGPMSVFDRYMRPNLCPLNKNGECTVYDVRPLVCRGHHSYSLPECVRGYENWRSNVPITLNTMRSRCTDAILKAMEDVMAFCKIDARSLELPEALTLALSVDDFAEKVCNDELDLDSAYNAELSEFAWAKEHAT